MAKSRKRIRKLKADRPRLHPEDREIRRLKEAYYSKFEMSAFDAKRDRFEALDLGSPELSVVDEVKRVVGVEGLDSQLFPFSWDSWDPGQIHVWRARRISRDKAIVGYVPEDLWEPPSRVVGQGRFNEGREPLFYACLESPFTALREARVSGEGAGFILMKYALTGGELRVKRVGVPNSDPDIRPRYRKMERQVVQFVVDTIRTPAEEHGLSTYGFTRDLLHEFYPLKGGHELGWRYESIQVPGTWNVALPAMVAHELLELRGVVVGRIAHDNGGHDFSVNFLDWTEDCEPRDGGFIGFPTFGASPGPGETMLDLLPD